METRKYLACAEKSIVCLSGGLCWWKYLRVRGEEIIGVPDTTAHAEIPPRARRRAGLLSAKTLLPEIPPRARRRELDVFSGKLGVGNTSACAEKSGNPVSSGVIHRKYLRVRGEERLGATRAGHAGNTSACAEKRLPPVFTVTRSEIPPRARRRVAVKSGRPLPMEIPPRARRRDITHRQPATAQEIPPRARRRVMWDRSKSVGDGNTSACAEKSSSARFRKDTSGNTSACAEKSSARPVLNLLARKYLRVRGEERHVRPGRQ